MHRIPVTFEDISKGYLAQTVNRVRSYSVQDVAVRATKLILSWEPILMPQLAKTTKVPKVAPRDAVAAAVGPATNCSQPLNPKP